MKNIYHLFKNAKFRRAFLAVVLVILLGGIYFYYQKTTDRVFINNSIIQAPVITVSPSVSGRVAEIDVREGDIVHAGDILAVVGSETLRADVAGLVISASDLTGSSVNPQTQLIQMINPVNLRVQGTLDEDKGLNKIRVGQSVSFTVDALPGNTYWGYIDEISPSAKASGFTFSTSSERTTQQFNVYANFDTTAFPAIKKGMSAKMTVYTRTK